MKHTFIFLFLSIYMSSYAQKLPENFVYLDDIDATIQTDLRYFTTNNFTGKSVDGYQNNCLIVSLKTANALKKIQQILIKNS